MELVAWIVLNSRSIRLANYDRIENNPLETHTVQVIMLRIILEEDYL